MRYFFPIHLDGGNRGCEAIAKGSAELLGVGCSQLVGLCNDIALDEKLGVGNFVTLVPHIEKLSVWQKVCRKIERTLARTEKLKNEVRAKYKYINFLKHIKKNDVMISTGGDMMCYGNNQVITTNNILHRKGIKTILWGCSMGQENLTPEKEETLHNFSMIYARESLSYEFFRGLGLKNVCLFPDPAFVLKPEECALPKCFDEQGVIGLNLSNYVLGSYSFDTPMGKEVVKMMDYLLKETNYHILLIPHVTWEGQDDRIVLQMLMDKYAKSGRVTYLDIENLNYCQIRYIISKCHLFIGARTHSVISAYATCVPTIAIGYSIKSRGIAKDLHLPIETIVDSKHVTKDNMINAVKYAIASADSIHTILANEIPTYIPKTYGVRNVVDK